MGFFENVFWLLKRTFIFVMVFSCIMNALMMTVPLYMLQVYDRVFASSSLDTLFYLTLIAIAALVILSVFEKIRSLILVATSNWLDNQLSPEALKRSGDELISGNVYPHQVLRDITQVRQFLCGQGMMALMDAPWAPIYLIVIYMLHPVLGFISTIGAIVLFLLAVFNEIATRQPLQKANELSQQSQFQINMTLRNAETIQAMGMMPRLIDKWFSQNADALNYQSIASARSSTIISVTKFLRLAIQVIMLGAGAYLVIHNHVTGGIMIAATIILSRALAPVEQAIGTWTQLTQSRSAYERLKEYFKQSQNREQSLSLPRPAGYLHVQQLTYSIPGANNYLLQKIDFKLQPGEILVILGPSASGKTSLSRLIVGALKPTEGSVRLDGADVFTWQREDFGQHIGYLPQSIELFPGTVKENIARMQNGSDEEIIKAAQKAFVHQMILKFPQGYETELKDAGARLSGGQRQRLALARALYGNPSLLVLDEPNASLDVEGEENLIKTLLAEKEAKKTIILISHKPSVLQIADKVLILKEGKIELFGTREEVVQRIRSAQKANAPQTSG